ncbi:DUF2489 domain-containing protein [Vibrio sp. JC009]|uniref:DUF2489 domain-containing protein n=1 Tax=Vibrio sp. JC009 TaxID=2912314 RepID=UPI0023B01ED8|nr:DUF2489 domain-containing protein [Vibrio sp. JC009]WED21908.1 DUF2489 domain-containing protein [Vibrio sp. JC009]
MSLTLLIALGVIIILALGGYAVHLLLKVKKQNQLRQEFMDISIAKRNANIFDSVNTLCLAGIQGQCDLAEVSIRVYYILDYVQGENRIDIEKEYPSLFELYGVVKNFARGEARQALVKKERMKQDLARNKAEARLTDAIIEELKDLQSRIQPWMKAPEDTVTVTSATC